MNLPTLTLLQRANAAYHDGLPNLAAHYTRLALAERKPSQPAMPNLRETQLLRQKAKDSHNPFLP